MVFIWGGESNFPGPPFAPGGGGAGGALSRVSCARRARESRSFPSWKTVEDLQDQQGPCPVQSVPVPAAPARLCGVSTGAPAVTLPAPALGSTPQPRNGHPGASGWLHRDTPPPRGHTRSGLFTLTKGPVAARGGCCGLSSAASATTATRGCMRSQLVMESGNCSQCPCPPKRWCAFLERPAPGSRWVDTQLHLSLRLPFPESASHPSPDWAAADLRFPSRELLTLGSLMRQGHASHRGGSSRVRMHMADLHAMECSPPAMNS